ncbi:unnamed protein product [Vitrella brassicaformis CCMP3155]|uniref:Uncharacterized protein n=8 Tax=Vitrella brassicaformis TaxID=1169539 RepID=A0A0G4FBC1_VITBC|nr:unnamed protein product [Vitrella brassicaformis CCMP3155]|eukprot:CEM09924.1 unnamed protein product [Vitrella brassicaformis CCMP3155]
MSLERPPKVGPKLKVKFPVLRRADFSEEIAALGDLSRTLCATKTSSKAILLTLSKYEKSRYSDESQEIGSEEPSTVTALPAILPPPFTGGPGGGGGAPPSKPAVRRLAPPSPSLGPSSSLSALEPIDGSRGRGRGAGRKGKFTDLGAPESREVLSSWLDDISKKDQHIGPKTEISPARKLVDHSSFGAAATRGTTTLLEMSKSASEGTLKKPRPPEPKVTPEDTQVDEGQKVPHKGAMGDGLPLELFDDPDAFEDLPPDEWVSQCQQRHTDVGISFEEGAVGPSPEAACAAPDAHVLHYRGNNLSMVPCYVLGYNEKLKRFQVELADKTRVRKFVRRLALRFHSEDPDRFGDRVKSCYRKKDHVELQQKFIRSIESIDTDRISPMLRSTKELFIRHCLNKAHIDRPQDYVAEIRHLLIEIEQNYVISMKFATIKDQLIELNGTSEAYVAEETLQSNEYASLLGPFLPPPVPLFALAEVPPPEPLYTTAKEKLSQNFNFSRPRLRPVSMDVWRRFEEVCKLRILDTNRGLNETYIPGIMTHMHSPTAGPTASFRPADFLEHLRVHRQEVTLALDRHWREFIVSEVIDKLSEEFNFFVDQDAKYTRSDLHRFLRKQDLILNQQMRFFVQDSIDEWTRFLESFLPNPDVVAPTPLLVLHIMDKYNAVRLDPDAKTLVKSILEAMNGIVECCNAIRTVEYELVPFCNIPETQMYPITMTFPPLLDAQKRVTEVLDQCLEEPIALLEEYKRYEYLLGERPDPELDTNDVEVMQERVAALVKAAEEVEFLSASVMRYPLFEVHTDGIVHSLVTKAQQLVEYYLEKVVEHITKGSQEVLEKWHEVHVRILTTPSNEDDLAKLKDFMANIHNVMGPLINQTDYLHRQIQMVSEFRYQVPEEVIESAFKAYSWPLQVQMDVQDTTRNLDQEKEKFMERLEEEKEAFEKDLAQYSKDLDFVRYEMGDFSQALKYAVKINGLKEALDRAKERVVSFQEREKLFGVEVSDFSNLDEMVELFLPYNKLWTMAIDFKYSEDDWLNGALMKLDATEIETSVDTWYKDAYKLAKEFDTEPVPKGVAEEVRAAIDAFKGNLPVIRALCQEAMQPRHWVELFENLDADVDLEDQLTLQQLNEIGIQKHIEKVEEISAVAQKEFGLKKTLATMKAEWKPMELEALPYKESGTYLLKGVDDVQTLLDDHIVKTQAIRGSPFIKPIEKECREWEAKLIYIQDLMEEWLATQRSWLYLEPIFSSEDIIRQMPVESRRFQQVDQLWRTTMAQVHETPNVLEISEIDNLLQNFSDANKKLDEIQKGLNDYLETKRLAFPRFFFLSNDELLMILSQTKDPTAVQPHMNKCFEGINKVKFDPTNSIIQAMVSAEGEVVPLKKHVDVNHGEKKGNVEKWLVEVEESMQNCLREVMKESFSAYVTKGRTEWCLEWPGQIVLCVDQLYWTSETEEAIQNKQLPQHKEKLDKELQDIVRLVRGDLTKLNRRTLGAMVTIDVHARDTIQALMDQNVKSADEFDWLAQLRYYWKPPGTFTMRDGKPNPKAECHVSMVNATLLYGFEYLGNSDRLVITPLTDRCYRTLLGAFHLFYGGAPEGPAGTGKTESTKDLAKAVSVQCVVFNCSDGLDYLAMAKFFKGLASSGAWCCFDEFNRIDLEVLSVIAQQVQSIQNAIRNRLNVFLFEGTEIKLVPTCAVNITMNPGYAGRSELPDNLKALFRPCAMMVPDYSLIAEIVLYSFGFEDARNIARKAVGSLRLSSEQLSSQDHYDFGMRALKAILTAAGQLKRKLGHVLAEDVLALRALSDVNVPKFTANDIPLFMGIISDLFPGVELPPSDYGKLVPQMEEAARSKGLQPKEAFINKCIQLWETVMVRHGLMLVGKTISGKSAVMDCLATSLGAIADGQSDVFLPCEIHKINPKSITQGQLYGEFDENTHEWADGVLALTVRYAAGAEPSKRQWIVLDGPVDAVWIENMNTVLDDNKKLCLNSGEIIKLSPVTTMMFEVEDLAAASPATVSRCGMVLLEPEQTLGWRPLAQSWVGALPQIIQEAHGQMILDMYERLMDFAFQIVTKKVKNPVPVSENWLMLSNLRMFEALLHLHLGEMKEGDDILTKDKKAALPPKEREARIEALFYFAIVWSIGACTDQEGRVVFDGFLRGFINGLPDLAKEYDLIGTYEPRQGKGGLPDKGLLYDYFIHESSGKWTPWTARIGTFDIPKDAQPHTIIVPTGDTVSNAYFLQALVARQFHVLFSGVTGTGKTVSVQSQLLTGFDKESFTSIAFSFSAQTSANQTQDIIDGKLDKRKKGTFGPPLGKKCLIFVDDLNLPEKEKYGAQPPIEILRQWMDTRGWYDRKTSEFRELVDLTFIAAMGPPGGGRNNITARYSRHYNLIFLTPFEEESLVRVFSTILTWYFDKVGFPNSITSVTQSIVKSTIDTYRLVSSSLLPTPAKSHYTFNLRDMSRVIQGLCLLRKESLQGTDDVVKCWAHECVRVFEDRLIDKADHNWFKEQLKQIMETNFKRKWSSLVTVEPLLFGDFSDPKKNHYQEMSDQSSLQEVMRSLLADYNSMNSKKQMNLVLFMSAIEHVARIVRILRQPLGNALLVGVGGSGRKSLTTLATFMVDYELFQIEISKSYGVADWREDLKRLLMKAGGLMKEVVFMISDTQLAKETFLEDTSGLLNTGEVPNLFGAEDKMTILDMCSKPAQAAGRNGPAEIMAFFVEQCRKNLHIVVCLSPIGEAFRRRLRMFPSLVNCCTIDWFMEWPEEALRSVANHFLAGENLSADVTQGVSNVCVAMQTSVTQLTERYKQEARRYYYVTPTSYLELINAFKSLLKSRRNDVGTLKSRYDVGLEKLLTTADQVAVMQQELEELQPKLKQTSQETANLMVHIEQKQKEAAVTQANVEKEEAICSKQAADASAVKEQCQTELDKAMPALEAALDALKKLSKGDITEVKSMKSPPPGVVLVMEALCIMFGIAPKKVPTADGKGKKDDYWEPAKKSLLGDAKFLQRLFEYDKDNIAPAIMEKIKPYEINPDFDPEVIKKASVAATGLCKWVRAMVIYDQVAKVVEPKKKALAEAEAELDTATKDLASKKAELKQVQDLVATLLSDFDKAKKKKEDLAKQVDDCSKRLVRADKLISGLGGERKRWTESSERLGAELASLTGDVLIASGIIAYLGVFTATYRQQCVNQWLSLLNHEKIPSGEEITLQGVVGDPVQIRQWVINKLPNDSLSIDNGIILSKSRRWPLMIDPQLQANKWVKTQEEKLKVLRLSQSDYARTLETCIQFGTPVLIENVGESLDPLLEPLLEKAIFKAGNIEMIRLGDSTVEYSREFKLYITTKLPNPHYPPELCVKVTLLNFLVTPEGLEDQMLGILVAREEPDTERKRQNLVVESAQSKAQLKQLEDKILELLSAAKGNILDDEELIETLSNSKVASQRIEERVVEQEKTQALINETRQSYRPVALRAAQLFFVISDMGNVDPMYQYSLEWFIDVFNSGIDKAEKFEKGVDQKLQKRLTALITKFLELLFNNVCRSLFEKDKLLFSFLLAIKMMTVDNELNHEQLRLFLLGGGGGGEPSRPRPAEPWLTDVAWGRLLEIERLGGSFDKFAEKFESKIASWKAVFDCENPRDESVHWPGGYKESLTPLEKCLVMLAVRPDTVVGCIQEFIEAKLGRYFLEPPTFDLDASYSASRCTSPLVFVLSAGADPMAELMKLASAKGMEHKVAAISLGQGQGPKAETAIRTGREQGGWVVLQNCHLAVSWLPTLEKLIEEFTPDTMEDSFRLWLTAMPSPHFPVSILQNGVKMTNEPPKGLRQNLLRSYYSFNAEFLEDHTRVHAWKKLLFGLCFFHASILERRKFGPLGWNIPYEFTESDRQICVSQLKMFLNEFAEIPYKALNYMAAEANYGGRVTDAWDRRTINFILSDFYAPDVLEDDYRFSPSGIYYAPASTTTHEGYLEFVRSLPLNEFPECFGLHANANLAVAISEAMNVIRTAMSLQPKTGAGAGKSPEEVFSATAADIVAKLPKLFDVEAVARKYPVRYDESMNTVLVQELMRFNKLLNVVRRSLVDVQAAVKGLVVSTPELEEVGSGLFDNRVPASWSKVAYPSLKPLGSWVRDFLARLDFMQKWIDEGPPPNYWISGFFFTQSFLTGTLQNYARAAGVPIDQLIYDYTILDRSQTKDVLKEKPEAGCYVYGLFMDGAQWDDDKKVVGESSPKMLFSDMPMVWLKPIDANDQDKTANVYPCPVYKTSRRAGTLSTTGHSTNYVMTIRLPIAPEHSEKYWTKRGVALLTQLDD